LDFGCWELKDVLKAYNWELIFLRTLSVLSDFKRRVGSQLKAKTAEQEAIFFMRRLKQILIGSAIAISIGVVSAVCWHSVEEIHYLKTFYPKQFSVQEAFYASLVELVKVIIISLPFILVAVCGIWLVCCFKKDKESRNDPSSPQ
jgi:hypothetical protein